VEPPTVRKSRCASNNALRVVNGRQDSGPVRGPDLPPLIDPERMVPPSNDPPTLYSPVPSIKYVVSLRGTGCLCFFEYVFPGCIGHHVPPSSTITKELSSLRPRSDDWAHCVDRSECVALPEPISKRGIVLFTYSAYSTLFLRNPLPFGPFQDVKTWTWIILRE